MYLSFFFFFFLRDQVPKNVLFYFSVLLIKSNFLSFFLLQDKVSNNVLYLLQSSSLSIEQVMKLLESTEDVTFFS